MRADIEYDVARFYEPRIKAIHCRAIVTAEVIDAQRPKDASRSS
jgi:hypothetical protein